MYPHHTTYPHTRYVSYNSSSISTCSNTTCRVLLLLAAACCCNTFAPDRDSRVLALCRCLPPDMVTACFAPVFFSFCSGVLFQINQNQPCNFMKQAYKQQQRDTIGCWLHHLYRSVAVRSDAWVMVMMLHLDCCIQRNQWSPRTFVSL